MQETRGPDRAAREQHDRRFQTAPIMGSRQIDTRHSAAPMTQARHPHAGPEPDALARRRRCRLEHVPRSVEMDLALRQHAPAER
jgi:hypothetical protein